MLSYNKNNIKNAKTLRKNMTPWERRLWYDFLRGYEIRFQRQKAIGDYIVDFYCARARLVIELDGGGHFNSVKAIEDEKRTRALEAFNLKVIRIPNNEIDNNFYEVCEYIDTVVKNSICDLNNNEMKTANIHSFESMAALDGDGIRYAVFFTGCPLRCVYCHNPDTWHRTDNEWTADALVKKIGRCKPYFAKGGGVTFSGGEPLLNAGFINETAVLLRQENINYAIDTSGSVPLTDEVRTALLGAELVILDIKFPDAESYAKYTGGKFDNFVNIGKFCTDNNIRLWLRTVIVPGINDTEAYIDKYAALVNQFRFEKYELLAFHTMGFFKYDRLEIENPLAGTSALDGARLDELQNYLNGII